MARSLEYECGGCGRPEPGLRDGSEALACGVLERKSGQTPETCPVSEHQEESRDEID